MKKDYFESLNLLIVILIFTFLSGSHVQAKSNKSPLIISKKIIAQHNNLKDKKAPSILDSHIKNTALRPKSDISKIAATDEKDDLFAALSLAKNTNPPPYNPKGKIDPFASLFRERTKIKDRILEPVDSGCKNFTQLEKIDLSQLKLSGVILSQSGNRGMVEESTGKGHVITVGTYIGIRGGKVVSISKGKVIVEEKMKNVYGEIFVKTREMKIVKKTDVI